MHSANCLDDVLLQGYAQKKLQEGDRDRIKDHVRECDRCRVRLEELSLQWAVRTATLRQPLTPEGVEGQIARATAIHNDAPKARTGAVVTEFGPYKYLKLIGQGTFGEVYSAEHQLTRRPCALKLLKFDGSSEFASRFLTEMRTLGQIDHPNVVKIYTGGLHDDRLFFEMELCEGGSVAQLLSARGGRMPVHEACELIRQAATGLAHLHEHEIVHRDFKIANLLVSKAGVVKIADFGVVLNPSAAEAGHETVVLGSAAVMAPEQAANSHTVTPAADVYSLGCCLFHLLTGRVPFAHLQTAREHMLAHNTDPFPDVRERRNDVPEELARSLERMVARDSGERPSAAEAARVLAPFARGQQRRGPVIASMGLAGGVGKSTFTAAAAQLFASAGHNVAIIDVDMTTAGITKYMGAFATKKTFVHTITDMAYSRHPGASPLPAGATQGMWDVTPDSVRGEPGRGMVFLIPSRLDADTRNEFDAMAKIPEDKRPQAALDIIRECIQRAHGHAEKIDCVLIDCGATSDNGLPSAAMVLADCGFILCRANPNFRGDINHLEQNIHRKYFPNHYRTAMRPVVNYAQPSTEELWAGTAEISFIPDYPAIRGTSGTGRPIDFMEQFKGVGLNPYFLAVLTLLAGRLDDEHKSFLPDEVETWVRPYVEAMGAFPQTVLARPLFRYSRWAIGGAFVLAALVALGGVCAMLFAGQSAASVVTTREIDKLPSESALNHQTQLAEIQIPAGLRDRVNIEGGVIQANGALTDSETERLKGASEYPPFRYAVVELGPASVKQTAEALDARRLFRILGGLATIFGLVGLVGAYVLRGWLRERIALLAALAAALSDRQRLTMYLIDLLRQEQTKPLLRWLRAEFVSHQPVNPLAQFPRLP